MDWELETKGPLVVGLGNPLMGDDGIGVTIARDLRSRDSLDVRVVEAGTPGFSLVDLLADDRCVIFIDAVDAKEEPGSVFWVDPAQLAHDAKRHSLHQITLADVLELLGENGMRSRIRIIGIQPERIGPGLKMSRILRGRFDGIASMAESMVGEALAADKEGDSARL